jgi:nucleoside-diphosphate-sugar epimerase
MTALSGATLADASTVPCASGAVLVTGATGFLGRAIARRLRLCGAPLRTTGRSDHAPIADVAHSACDLTQRDQLARLFDGVSTVVHAAGLAHRFGRRACADDEYRRTNVEATRHVAEAAARAGARHLVLIGSVAVYGPGEGLRDEASPSRPDTPYGASKLAAEHAAEEVARRTGLRLAILRLPTLYGPSDPGQVLRLVRLLARGRFVWIGRGENRKTLLHVDDAAGAVEAVVLREVEPGTYNVAAAPVTMREIVEGICLALRRPPPLAGVPARCGRGLSRAAAWLAPAIPAAAWAASLLEKFLADDAYDGARFAARCGFAPQVELAAGLAEEVAWWQGSRGGDAA